MKAKAAPSRCVPPYFWGFAWIRPPENAASRCPSARKRKLQMVNESHLRKMLLKSYPEIEFSCPSPELSRNLTTRSFAIPARRRERRTRAVMRIKVSAPADPGSIQQQSACTLDVAGRGARISGVKFSGKIGDTVVVERGHIRAGFKVAWIGQAGTSRDGQLGLQATERVLGLWGIETAPPDDCRGIEPDGLVPSL